MNRKTFSYDEFDQVDYNDHRSWFALDLLSTITIRRSAKTNFIARVRDRHHRVMVRDRADFACQFVDFLGALKILVNLFGGLLADSAWRNLNGSARFWLSPPGTGR